MLDVELRDGVPEDYADFCDKWYAQIERMVMLNGGHTLTREDRKEITQELVTAFGEANAVERFDSSHGSGAKFSTWVYSFMLPRIMGKRDKAIRRSRLEGVSLDIATGLRDEPFVDTIPAPGDDFEMVYFKDETDRIHAQLLAEFAESDTASFSRMGDMPKLFRCLCDQIINGVTPNRAVLAHELGLSTGAVSQMMRRLRLEPAVVTLLTDG